MSAPPSHRCSAEILNPSGRCQMQPHPRAPPLQGPLRTPTPCDCPSDLIIASCRVSVLQKCEWRSDTARTKGCSAAPAGQADRLAAGTHNEIPQTHK